MEKACGSAAKGRERLATPPTARSQCSVKDRERERTDERCGRGVLREKERRAEGTIT